jgi:hypothetical protein
MVMEILLAQMKPFLAPYKLELQAAERKILAFIYRRTPGQERHVLD